MGFKRRIAEQVADAMAFALGLGNENSHRFFVDALWERYPVPVNSVRDLDISLYCPDEATPDAADEQLVKRIFVAYEKASRLQQKVDPNFRPSSMWQRVLRAAYADLRDSLPSHDIERAHHFLANFAASKVPTGIEESRLIRQCAADPTKRRHFEQKIVSPLLHWWLRLESNGRGLSELEIPGHGNLGGTIVNGCLISPGSVFSEIHGRLIAGFVESEQPIIGELGGGFGRLCFFLARNLHEFCYVGFDLPEILCCATYYLMKTFPDKRFLLFGEEEWDSQNLQEFDFVLLPSFEITKLPDNSVDLFINENSLGEMEAHACRNYVGEICRCANAFWHRNHEVLRFEFDGNAMSLVNQEYPIPTDKFAQIVRYADLGPLIRADRLDRDSDMFWYYYRARHGK